jgi:VanZ family protein
MKYATISISLLIIAAVLIPGPNLPDVSIGGFDKVVHMGMFALWAIAVRYDFDTKPFKFFIVFLAGIFFSILTEILQLMIEGRNFDVYDMAADGIGLIAGLLVSGEVLKLLKRLK